MGQSKIIDTLETYHRPSWPRRRRPSTSRACPQAAGQRGRAGRESGCPRRDGPRSGRQRSAIPAGGGEGRQDRGRKAKEGSGFKVKEICPRGNNKVIIYFLIS